MAKVITLSQTFPAYHPKSRQPTLFVEQVLNALGIDYHSGEYLKILKHLNDSSKVDLIGFFFSLGFFEDSSNEKLHTIRAKSINKNTGEVYSRWKQGDKASLRVWSGTPYKSPQIIIAPEVELVQVGKFLIHPDAYNKYSWVEIGEKYWHKTDEDINKSILSNVAKNDGLSIEDFLSWFKYPKPFEGQILAWKDVDYV